MKSHFQNPHHNKERWQFSGALDRCAGYCRADAGGGGASGLGSSVVDAPDCRVRRLGVLRYEAVATTAFAARWFPDGVDAAALAASPVVDFDRRDDLQTRWLARRGVAAADPPRHRVPASQDFATAVELGLGWGLLPSFQSATGLSEGALVRLGDDPIEVPLFWQQWNLTSALLDDVAEEVVDEGRRVLAAD